MTAEDSPIYHQILTKDIISSTVKKDLGLKWKLIDYKIKDFTKMGDNYATAVTSILCRVMHDGIEKDVTYIAKLNPLRQMADMDEILRHAFYKESTFCMDLIIQLNECLQNIGLETINHPVGIFYEDTPGKEVFISKDLRSKGYKMYEGRMGMDIEHSLMLIKELAKMHAASFLYKKKIGNKSMIDLYPCLLEPYLDRTDEATKGIEFFRTFLSSSVENSAKLIKNDIKYKKQYLWLLELNEVVLEAYIALIETSPESMKLVGHGDCWTNNVLFRYNEEGNPLSVALLDFQLCKFSSICIDLNYFFYTSLGGDVRNKHYDYIVSTYYAEFKSITEAASVTMPFTEDEFRRELYDKILFGVISGIMGLTVMFCDSKDAPDFSKIKDGKITEFMANHYENMGSKIVNDPAYVNRFVALMNDISEKGVIDKLASLCLSKI